ncbi:hypothetical protein OAV85_01000 [Candidatus Nanopelagicales bacterium]|nr:hypothetical protein [Candidatus Nanopelagicales bacterium]
MFARIGITAALVASLALAPMNVQAAPDPKAEPPNPAELRETTTALLQPGDVTDALGSATSQNIGYYIPTGGQDPYPVCITPPGKEALPDLTMTTGYFSNIGNVNQQAVVYSSAEAAQSAWSALTRKIQRACSYSGKVDGKKTVVTNGALDNGAVWTRRDSKSDNYGSEYTIAALADEAIISLRVTNPGKASTTAAQRDAVDALLPVLSDRYTSRSTGGGVQSTLLSIAEAAMVTPEDMPATLPIDQPADGAWSDFTSTLPGTVPFNPCYPGNSDILPAGTGNFSASYGGTGDIQASGASVWQQVFTYADDSAADAAWKQLSKGIQECTARAGKLYSKTDSAWKSTEGTSAVSVDGTPGIYVRYITTQGGDTKDSRFTSRTYQLILKDGNAISWLSYSAGVPGIRKLNINEPAVNQLAVELIDRFANTVVTLS